MLRKALPTLLLIALSAVAAGQAGAIDSSEGIPRGSGSECDQTRRGGFVGIGGDSLRFPQHQDCILGLQALSGAGVLRVTLDWKGTETSQGQYAWSAFDSWMRSVARHRMRVLPILFNTPPFYGRQAATGSYPPRSMAAFARFARAAVERYGSNGAFWSENPDVPKVPITDWQIWNEPSLTQYWRPRPKAKAYVKMLKAVYPAIKGADRRAKVVTAGLPDSLQGGAVRLRPYVAQMYQAGAARYFDVLGVNLYGRNAKEVLKNMSDVRALMNAPKVGSLLKKLYRAKPGKAGKTVRSLKRKLPRKQRRKNVDPRGGIWLTEIGWGTGGPRHRFNLGEARQAREIGKLFKGLHKQRRKLKLRGIIYFGWQDQEPYPPAFKDQWGLHTGLFDRQGNPKPGYEAYRRVAPGLR
jgi:hypothetical protein